MSRHRFPYHPFIDYLPTFGLDLASTEGKYTSPMDGSEINTLVFSGMLRYVVLQFFAPYCTTDVMYKDEFNKQKHVPGLDSPEDLTTLMTLIGKNLLVAMRKSSNP